MANYKPNQLLEQINIFMLEKCAYQYCLVLLLMVMIVACESGPALETEEAIAEVQTPVTLASPVFESMSEYVELNATSSFLLKNFVKANATGYLQSADVKLGQAVNRGQVLFTIKTKEAQSLGNAVNSLDSTFRFSGTNSIKAGDRGFVTQLNHQQGDYVQDGEQLAVISDLNSFVFLLDLPYELKPYISGRPSVEMILPDGEKLTGSISGSMPSVDATAQTQSIVIKTQAGHAIPENLIAKVRIPKIVRSNAASLPRSAVLTDETQTNFWIMKLIDSTTAVKVPIKKGIETGDRVEILSPALTSMDKIVVSGNYGLADTAKIKIIQEQNN